MTSDHGTLKTVELTLAIVQALVERDGLRVTELATELDIAPSTAHNHLKTLMRSGYVINNGSIYYPSMEFLRIGEYARRRTPSYEKAETQVKTLAEDTGGRVHFVIEELGRGRYVFTSTGDLAVETFSTNGDSFPLHVTASGKAILAALPKHRTEEIIERHGLEAKTDRTITDADELLEELEEIRQRGVSFNVEEHKLGINAVAAPVRKPNGGILGALTISGPAKRLTETFLRDQLKDTLLATVNQFELEITYSD